MKQYILGCRDIGVDCDFKAKAQDKNEVLKEIAAHAKLEHNLQNIPPELQKKCFDSIKEVEA